MSLHKERWLDWSPVLVDKQNRRSANSNSNSNSNTYSCCTHASMPAIRISKSELRVKLAIKFIPWEHGASLRVSSWYKVQCRCHYLSSASLLLHKAAIAHILAIVLLRYMRLSAIVLINFVLQCPLIGAQEWISYRIFPVYVDNAAVTTPLFFCADCNDGFSSDNTDCLSRNMCQRCWWCALTNISPCMMSRFQHRIPDTEDAPEPHTISIFAHANV